MDREKLLKDNNFIKICEEYKTDYHNFEIYGDVIKLNTTKDNVYVLIDNNYDFIGVYGYELSLEHQTGEELTKKIEDIYKKYSEVDMSSKSVLPKPIEHLSLKQVNELAKRIVVFGFYKLIINGKVLLEDRKLKRDELFDIYCNHFNYIVFLDAVEKYFFNECFNNGIVDDFYEYLNKLSEKIIACVIDGNERSKRNNGILSYRFGDFTGLDDLDIYGFIVNDVMFLFNNYVIHNHDNKRIDLGVILKILEEPYEDVLVRLEKLYQMLDVVYVRMSDFLPDKEKTDNSLLVRKKEKEE